MCTLSIVDQEKSVDGDDDSKSTCVTIISKTGGGRKDEESKQKTKSYRILSPIFIILTVIMTTLVAILVLCIAVCLCVTPVDDEASMQTNHTEVPKSKENDDTKSSVSLLEYNRLMNQVVKLNATVKRLERQIELKSNQTEAKKLGIRDSWVCYSSTWLFLRFNNMMMMMILVSTKFGTEVEGWSY